MEKVSIEYWRLTGAEAGCGLSSCLFGSVHHNELDSFSLLYGTLCTYFTNFTSADLTLSPSSSATGVLATVSAAAAIVVYAVHYQQTRDRNEMHKGVIRDKERRKAKIALAKEASN